MSHRSSDLSHSRSLSPSLLALLVLNGFSTASRADVEESRAWDQAEIPIRVAAGANIDRARMEALTLEAMQVWNDTGLAPLLVLDDGPAAEGFANDGVNQILFVTDGWLGAPQDLASTKSSVVKESRIVLDADILLNAEHHVFSTDTPASDIDLQSLLTHELGHLLGLRHVEETEAAMFPKLDPHTTNKRELTEHDLSALEEAYANFVREDMQGGCSQTSPSTTAPALLLALALMSLRRSNKRARRHQ
jgi:predicted Zn-dependent protease